MKTMYFIIVLVMGAATSSPAQTDLYGTIPGGVWTKDGSPYIVNGTVFVQGNLFIEPGVSVIFNFRDGYVSWLESNKGYIHAIGTESDSILFTLLKPDDPITAFYNWLVFKHQDSLQRSNVFKYCIFEKGLRGYYGLPSNSDVADTIMHSTFRDLITGIGQSAYEWRSNIYVSDCQFYRLNNPVLAVDDSLSNLWMERCTIFDCWNAIFWGSPGSVSVKNSVFRNNKFEPIILFNPGEAGTLQVDLGGDPLYCNKFYNNNTTRNNGNKNIVVEPGVIVNALYNYWGDTHPDSVRACMEDPAGVIGYIPYTDENCQPYTIGVEETQIPIVFDLESYPNPVAAGTPVTLRYTLERASQLTLVVRDVLGRIVSEQSLGAHVPGEHSYAINTSGLRPGLYFYTLHPATGTALSGKLVVCGS